jgi:hypothetical protein
MVLREARSRRRVRGVAPALIAAACVLAVAIHLPVGLQAQHDESRAADTLDTLESVLGWSAPDPRMATDVRVMTRSALAIAPLPLVRLTAGEDDRVVATVTEWGAPDLERADGRPLFFKYLPLACAGDRLLCAGTPRVVRTPEAKALWFALFIARSCNDRPRKVLSDAEDLYVRGRVGGIAMTFSCRAPNPRGPSPGDRQAAAVLRMSHRLLGR